MKKLMFVVAFGLLLLFAPACTKETVTPEELTENLTGLWIRADQIYNPNAALEAISHLQPLIAKVPFHGYFDGIHFQKEVLNRSEEEIEVSRKAFINYLESEYHFNVDKLLKDSSVILVNVVNDPRVNLHVHALYGETSHRFDAYSKWKVIENTWILYVTDPEGIDLSPNWGPHVAYGSFFKAGEFLIDRPEKPFTIAFKTGTPLMTHQFGWSLNISQSDYVYLVDDSPFGKGAIEEEERSTYSEDMFVVFKDYKITL